MMSEGEVNGQEDFREEKARQSSEVRAKNLTVTDGIHISLSEVLMQTPHAPNDYLLPAILGIRPLFLSKNFIGYSMSMTRRPGRVSYTPSFLCATKSPISSMLPRLRRKRQLLCRRQQ